MATPSPISIQVPVPVTASPAQMEAQKEIEQGPALVAAAVPHTAKFTDLGSFASTLNSEPAPIVSAPVTGGFARVASSGVASASAHPLAAGIVMPTTPPPNVKFVTKKTGNGPSDPAELAICDSCA